MAAYERAVALNPAFAAAYYNLGNVLDKPKRTESALAAYERALSLKPDSDYLQGVCLFFRLLKCDWAALKAGRAELAARIGSGQKAVLPLHALTLVQSLGLQRRAAETWVDDLYPSRGTRTAPANPGRGRIRLGYFSADFRMHPVALLLPSLELIELGLGAQAALHLVWAQAQTLGHGCHGAGAVARQHPNL